MTGQTDLDLGGPGKLQERLVIVFDELVDMAKDARVRQRFGDASHALQLASNVAAMARTIELPVPKRMMGEPINEAEERLLGELEEDEEDL